MNGCELNAFALDASFISLCIPFILDSHSVLAGARTKAYWHIVIPNVQRLTKVPFGGKTNVLIRSVWGFGETLRLLRLLWPLQGLLQPLRLGVL